MSKALHAFYCKYGPYLIIAILLCLVMFSQFEMGPAEESVEDLGLPKATLSKTMESYNALNTYKTRAQASKKGSITFLVRTYQKFTKEKVLDRLLDNLNRQKCSPGNDAACKLDISTIVFSTDVESISVTAKDVKAYSDANQHDVDVHVHTYPLQVYKDNQWQIEKMCFGKEYASAWRRHTKLKYGQYHHPGEKIDTVCKGNNLLHYLLTDMTLRYVVDGCRENCEHKYVTLTNGDNTYDENFVWKTMEKLEEDGSTDFVMTDYLERGERLVESTTRVNQMDLGCMVFRLSFLKRLFPRGLIYLASLPTPNAWPDHYYGADGEFIMHVVNNRGARWARVQGALFTHW